MADPPAAASLTPHAFHCNLPPHHCDPVTGIPYVTTFASAKASRIVDLCHSIQLSPSLFVDEQGNLLIERRHVDEEQESDAMEADVVEDEDDDAVEPSAAAAATPPDSLQALAKKCARLHSQLSGLEGLKHTGLTQRQLADMVVHLLRLVTASIDYQVDEQGRTKVQLYYETVGGVWTTSNNDLPVETGPSSADDLARDLARPFALHSTVREALLLVLINILSNKGLLRSISNAAVFTGDTSDRFMLVLYWKALLRTLLRTAPYLDERQMGHTRSDSNYRQSTVLKRTVQLIRDARHFFDQGLRPNAAATDQTARELWTMVAGDVRLHSHTHACYRGTILLYLFLPSRCSPTYYLEVLPLWLESWTNIDRCPEFDFLWLALFCRARKHVSPDDYDWGPLRRRLLTHAQYWLQLPIGGAAMDKSFPRASNPRSRSCPPRLKVFTGAASSYEEGIDFVAKVVKLIVTSLGTGQLVTMSEACEGDEMVMVSEGTNDILRFLSFVTPYFNPSNLGSWTFTLGAFLHYFCYELCCRAGASAGAEALRELYPDVMQAMAEVQPGEAQRDIPPREMVLLLDALLPLCQQAIYSKNGHVGRAGEAAMLYLVQIDPARATPAFVDFAARALDIVAVNLSHQAPAALSALTRLIQPALRSDPSVLLIRLPDILRLSLAGIDSNDQNKTIRTLILYRSLTSWLPVGGTPETWCVLDKTVGEGEDNDGTMRLGRNLFDIIEAKRESPEYCRAIDQLPETSLLKQGAREQNSDADMQLLVLEEAVSAMSDWALEFLDRVFGLLRASGEREKAGKTTSGVATRHSTADVHQARNFSRVLTECLLQLFAAMDDQVHDLATRSVVRFLEEETLPSAAKDSSLLCQAVAAARETNGVIQSPGLDALIPVLTDDLRNHSTKTVIYRVRCLAGAVQSAGRSVVVHRAAISAAIEFALSSDDRHLFKTGCKLLRHTLSTLSESYPIASDTRPRLYRADASRQFPFLLGRSAQLHGDKILWHVPDAECIRFASDLVAAHVTNRLDALCASTDGMRSKLLSSTDMNELRRCLRVVRYSIRGGASLLLDEDPSQSDDHVPYEMASYRSIDVAGEAVKNFLLALRGRLCSFLIVLSSVIASETLYPEAVGGFADADAYRKVLPLICSDPKVCKETCDLALLLLTRRGAFFRSQEARTVWKAQKQVTTDFTLCAQVDRMVEALQSAGVFRGISKVLYKDGEDAGKTIPRRLLVVRVHLFHNGLQRNASFEVPRRLRRFEREHSVGRNILFSVKPTLPESVANLEDMLKGKSYLPLDAYEGIVDGLFALCCHSNTQVRASAISVVDYAMTRFGWIVASRVPRILSGLALHDSDLNGKFGVPSCASLVDKLSHQGKRKRLAEAIKGVCSILSLTRSVRQILGSWKMRLRFVQTVCGTEYLISLLPAEEMQKIIHYLQAVFSPFRTSYYVQPRTSSDDKEYRESCLSLVLDILSEKKVDSDSDTIEKKGAHWRKLLMASWFLLVFIDEEDVTNPESTLTQRAWSTCFRVLENEAGQPLQRVALGVLGKMVSLLNKAEDAAALQGQMLTESFCKVLGKALVYDHKEDTSVGSGHEAQWSSGVENIIRDASRHIAPRTLFPFQRTSQSLGSFKVSHSQLLEMILARMNHDVARAAGRNLLAFSRECAGAPPSEDQRNQQVTSAEIFAGVCGFLVRSSESSVELWSELLLPHLDEVMAKIPFSLCGAYFDAIRYSLQFAPSGLFEPLTLWLVEKIESTLWQPNDASMETAEDATGANGSSHGNEQGFTAQSKWLFLFSAVIIEMDETEADNWISSPPLFHEQLLSNGADDAMEIAEMTSNQRERSWQIVTDKLLPRLTNALGHPFDSCRDHISRCLFRICYSHRKMARTSASRAPSRSNSTHELAKLALDPGLLIVKKLGSLEQDHSWSYKDRFNALSTARRFISYCVHLGEAKFEYSDYVIPLLPLAFEALNATSEEDGADISPSASQEDNAARRALEAEVIKGFRFMISEVSITAVISYGRNTDITRVLDAIEAASNHPKWQVRHASANFLRCFQGAHKFLFGSEHSAKTTAIVTSLLVDERREVSSAAMAALTGVLAVSPADDVARMVKKYSKIASASKMKKSRKSGTNGSVVSPNADAVEKEKRRARNQQVSVFVLCATIMSQPYDTPAYVPEALAAISKHSFERNAPLGVRDTVKKCCAEYKRTHMSDNWEVHRSMFSQEQLEAFEDVVSTPHYYA